MSSAGASSCKVKDVQSTPYTTTDGYVITNVAYINTFTLACENSNSDRLALFAEIPFIGKTLPVIRSADGKRYQVSWAEDIARARSGEQLIKVYDEEGHSALRKAQRKADETKTSVEAVEPLFTLSISHPGTYKGPLVPIEFLAVAMALFVYYVAYSAKSKLTV